MRQFFSVMEVSECEQELKKVSMYGIEERNIIDSIGYVLAEDIYAKEDIPQGIRSCMDGYAVQSKDTIGASEHNPLYLECIDSVTVEEPSKEQVSERTCMEIVTGAILPEGADAVVMVEYTQVLGKGTIAIGRSVTPKEHCMLAGEDAKKDSIALCKNTRIRTQEVALLATLGFSSIRVYRKPKIAIFSTGNEIVEPESSIRPGLVRDANSYSVEGLLRSLGYTTSHFPIVPDDVKILQERLEESLECSDIVLLSGGSSIGSRDHTIEAIENIEGIRIITHGLAMQPGKPTIIAKRENQYIIGLPGQIASAYSVLVALVIPFIEYCSGNMNAFERNEWHSISAILTRNIAGTAGRESWIRVALQQENGEYYASPVLGKSGLLRTLIETSGVIVIPADTEGIEEGSKVQVYSL